MIPRFLKMIRSARLDQTGVGKLMELALKLGKSANPNLHVGICGEHGGDPTSVEFCRQAWAGLCILFTVPRSNCKIGGS